MKEKCLKCWLEEDSLENLSSVSVNCCWWKLLPSSENAEKVNPSSNTNALKDNHSAGVDKLIKLHAWLLALRSAASRKNDIFSHYCAEHMVAHTAARHGGRNMVALSKTSGACRATSWGWAKRLECSMWRWMQHKSHSFLSKQPLITFSAKEIFNNLTFFLPASFFSRWWRAAASSIGRHRNKWQSLIFIMWVLVA